MTGVGLVMAIPFVIIIVLVVVAYLGLAVLIGYGFGYVLFGVVGGVIGAMGLVSVALVFMLAEMDFMQ